MPVTGTNRGIELFPEDTSAENSSAAQAIALPDISVVIPIFNENDNIELLVNEVHASLDNLINYEIIIVDDGSTDDVANTLLSMMPDADSKLRLIRHKQNYGQSTAIYSGIQAARAEWIITLDGDGQNNPGDILSLINARNDSTVPDLKLVCGYRKRRNDNIIKLISSRIANSVRSKILNDMTPDTGCGLKLIHRRTFLELPCFDHMHRFLPALIRRSGNNTISIEVSHRARTKGRSKYGINNRLWTGIIDLMGVIWLIKRNKTAIKSEVTKNDS